MYIGHCSFTVTWWDYRLWALIQLAESTKTGFSTRKVRTFQSGLFQTSL